MSNEVNTILEGLINPVTGKTLSEENRIKEVKLENDSLSFSYNREGITPDQKRVIENNIYSALAGKIAEDKITVMTVSDDSKDVFESHGTLVGEGEEIEDPHTKDKVQTKEPATKDHTPSVGKPIPGINKVIAVSSGKGGVGKSTVSTNLAISLKNQGYKVGLIDADVYGPSIPLLLGQPDAKPVANDNEKIEPIDAHGIKFMSFGLFIGESEPVIWRGPMLNGVLKQFFFDVDWGDLDYLIIDLPPGTGDVQLSMVQNIQVDGALVVSTPQDVALLDAKKGLQMFRELKIPILGMIENMSYFLADDSDKKYFIFGEGGVRQACIEMDTNMLGEIPIEIALRESCDNGHPYMANNLFEGRAVWNAYIDISKKIDSIFNTATEKKGFFSKIFS